MALAVFIVYGRVLSFDLLLWDDNLTIRGNRLLFPRVSWSSVLEFFRGPQFGMYMPVTLCFFGLEAWISQQLPWSDSDGVVHPWVFHAGNLVLHTACVWLVYRIICNLKLPRRAAGAGALLFALHPLQVEPVAWATETKTLMAAMWSLAAILLYLRIDARVSRVDGVALPLSTRHWFGKSYFLASVCFALALMSKPTAVIVPILVALLAWGFQGHHWKRQAMALTPWLAMSLMIAVLTKSVQPDAIVHHVPGVLQRLLVAGDAIAFYLARVFVPVNLAIDYGRTPLSVLSNRWAVAVGFIPLVLLVAFWIYDRRGSYLVAYLVFVVALLPVVGFVPFEFQNISTVADRYVYLGLLGPSVALAVLLARHPGRWLRTTAYVLLAVFAMCSFRQVRFWQNDEVLFARALEVNPDSHSGLVNLSLVRMRQATIDPSRWKEAEDLLGRALEVAPTPQVQVEDLSRISTAYLSQGNLDAAAENLLKAQELVPDDPRAYSNLGDVLAAAEHYDAALQQYDRAIELNPNYARPQYRKGDVLRKLCRYEDSIAAYEQVLTSRPALTPALRGLALCHADQGNSQQAIELYDEAIASQPQQYVNYYEKGLLLFKVGNFNQAEKLFRRAIQLNPRAAEAHNDLATTLVKLNRLSEAVQHYRLALKVDSQLVDAQQNLRKVEQVLSRN